MPTAGPFCMNPGHLSRDPRASSGCCREAYPPAAGSMRARPLGEPSVSNKAYIVEAAFFFFGAFFFFLAVLPALFCAA